MAKLGDRVSFIALEYGTYSPDRGRKALREDHWLHAYGKLDRQDPEDWREMVLFRSRQFICRALARMLAR